MIARIARYFGETKEELSRVSWPNRELVVKHTLLVIIVSLAVAAYLGAADYLFSLGFARFFIR